MPFSFDTKATVTKSNAPAHSTFCFDPPVYLRFSVFKQKLIRLREIPAPEKTVVRGIRARMRTLKNKVPPSGYEILFFLCISAPEEKYDGPLSLSLRSSIILSVSICHPFPACELGLFLRTVNDVLRSRTPSFAHFIRYP